MEVLKFKSFDENEPHVLNTEIIKQPIWGPPKENDSNYLQDYLKTILNRLVKADFLLGDNTLITKEGILKEVGNDYILLELLQSNDLLLCDIYSIKFVQIV